MLGPDSIDTNPDDPDTVYEWSSHSVTDPIDVRSLKNHWVTLADMKAEAVGDGKVAITGNMYAYFGPSSFGMLHDMRVRHAQMIWETLSRVERNRSIKHPGKISIIALAVEQQFRKPDTMS